VELCDSHCHIQLIGNSSGDPSVVELWAKGGLTDPEVVIKRAKAAFVNRFVCIGCNLQDSQLAVEFVANRTDCWAAVGFHPHEAKYYVNNQAAKQQLTDLVVKPMVVAIGECGLDYHYLNSPKADQRELLKFQIELAQKYQLPLVFHVREAFDDFWPIFESYHDQSHPIRGVLHSFTDSPAQLKRAVSNNLFIGVNGIATFTKNALQLETYRKVPLSRLLLETDAPFLTPSPYRGKICEPYHVKTIAEFLAELRRESVETLAEATTKNVRQLFNF
jgi:TatD DNase family protein